MIKKQIKCSFRYLVAITQLLLASVSYATAILNIIPISNQAIEIGVNGSGSLSYVVTNNTSSVINNISIDPYYNFSIFGLALSLQSNTCSSSLDPGGTCSFTVFMQSLGDVMTTVLSPRVCGYNGAVCSTPVANNRVLVSTVSKTLYAYVSNSTTSRVYICTVNDQGSFETCVSSTGNGTFAQPTGVAVNSAGTMLYVSNSGSNTISVCPINGNSLGTCSAETNTISAPLDIVLNANNTLAYVISGSNQVYICNILPNGSLSACSPYSNGDFDSLQGITLDATNSFAYIANNGPGNGSINICSTLGGVLGPCTLFTDSSVSGPMGLSFDPGENVLYVGNSSSGTVAICQVLGPGVLGPCSLSSESFAFNVDFSANQYTTTSNNHGYFPYSPGGVTICHMNTIDGTLDACSVDTGSGVLVGGTTAVSLALVP